MGKKIIFSKLLIGCLVFLGTMQVSSAAPSADSNVTATLSFAKDVFTNGGNIAATIDPTTGSLSAALAPGFTLHTNFGNLCKVYMTATVNTANGSRGAFTTDGGFIALTNSTALPLNGSVVDALSASPTTTGNPNVIVYAVNPPEDVAQQLAFTWDHSSGWNGDLTHAGDTNTSITIPANVPRASTFSAEDLDGSYQATVTLSFI